MALQSPEPGNYYEFKAVCDAGALLVFHVHEHRSEEEIKNQKTGRVSKVQPVIADILVLDGGSNPALAKTVVRQEKIIGRGITGSLRRVSIGNDGVFRMAWGEGEVIYPQANAVGEADMALAADVFQKTNGDPYTHAERAANPTGGLQTAAPAPTQPAANGMATAPWQPAPAQTVPAAVGAVSAW